MSVYKSGMFLALMVSAQAFGQTSFWPTSAVPVTKGVADDTAAVTLGLKFYSDVAGSVTAVRFYKGTGNTGTHIGTLWSATGAKLAAVTFSGETASGWQQANFPSPVSLTANTPYVISYFAPRGNYAEDQYFGWSRLSSASLHVSGSSPGVYQYGAASVFPTSVWNNTNYWVDLVFVPGSTYTISGNVSGTSATLTLLSGTTSVQTTTGSGGSYNFSGLLNKSYVVAPSQSGYTFTPSTASVTVNGASVTGVNFTGAASAVPHSVSLNWNASTSPGVVAYNVYRANGATGPYVKLSTVSATAYVDSSVTAGQTYFYVATSVDGGSNESPYSNQSTASVPTP